VTSIGQTHRMGKLLRRLVRPVLAIVISLEAIAALALCADQRALGPPVRGARVLTSTFGAPRSGGRRHAGTDIFAPRGTPVLAAHDGMIVRIGSDRLGGTVMWTVGRRGVLCYYAHLDRIAEGMWIGRPVAEGETVAYVGNTGNARRTSPHLHFESRPLALALVAIDPVVLLR
jgi:murein DD-endopeptidase MepM/ murein hydrolase activator NlpD